MDELDLLYKQKELLVIEIDVKTKQRAKFIEDTQKYVNEANSKIIKMDGVLEYLNHRISNTKEEIIHIEGKFHPNVEENKKE